MLDVEYTDGSTPYVVAMFLRNADAFRYWRWAEQWKTSPGAIDAIWMYPFLSSAFELYATPTEPIPAPGIYHGLVTVRANIVGHMYVCVVSEVKRSHSHVVVAGIEQRVSVTPHGEDIVKHQAIYGIGIVDLRDAHGEPADAYSTHHHQVLLHPV